MTEAISYKTLVSIIFKQLNIYREDPSRIYPILERRLKKYEDKKYIPTDDPNLTIQTEEGPQVVKQLMSYLMKQTKYPRFKWSYQLHCAANYKAKQLAHIDQYGVKELTEDVQSLVDKFAEWNGSLSEHVLYGFCDPQEIISELLIDDGNYSRDNRKQFYNPSLHEIGIGIQKHDKYQFVIVFILATKTLKKQQNKRYPSISLQRNEQTPLCNNACSII